MPEIRFEAPEEAVAVLDGYCSATGKSRTTILLQLLKAWSSEKINEATLICRVAGINPTAPERRGKGSE